MKKLILLTCIILVFTTMGGCMLLLGGANERELGTFIPIYSDGVNNYFEYELTFEKGLIKKTTEGYAVSELSTNDEAISVKNTGVKVVLEAYVTALFGGADCADGYDYLYNALDSAFDISAEDNYSNVLLLENQGEIYGAINFYSRSSGVSGNLLTHENIVKSLFVNYADGGFTVEKEFDKTAILAFNKNNCITYDNKRIYSVDLSSGEETFLFKDKSWDRGPSYYNNFSVSFTDEDFVVYYSVEGDALRNETLMAGNLDGTCITTLIDNKEIEY